MIIVVVFNSSIGPMIIDQPRGYHHIVHSVVRIRYEQMTYFNTGNGLFFAYLASQEWAFNGEDSLAGLRSV